MLNRPVQRDGHAVSPRSAAEFEVYEDATESVAALRQAGFLVMVVTNQPDVARGHLARSELDRMTERLQRAIAADEVRVCPHDDADACSCRKPKPGMLHELSEKWGIDLNGSFIVGDSWRDMQAGRAAGCRTIFLDRSGATASDADHSVRSLSEAAKYICRSQPTA